MDQNRDKGGKTQEAKGEAGDGEEGDKKNGDASANEPNPEVSVFIQVLLWVLIVATIALFILEYLHPYFLPKLEKLIETAKDVQDDTAES